jgi:hypothetical protein
LLDNNENHNNSEGLAVKQFICLAFLIATNSCNAAEQYPTNKGCELTVSIGNVYCLGRDQGRYNTSEHDRHRVGGLICNVHVDNIDSEYAQSCHITYKFFDVNDQLSVGRQVALEELPVDYALVQVNRSSHRTKLVLKELPESLKTTINTLKIKAGNMLLYPHQEKLDNSANIKALKYGKSAWDQEFDSDTICTEPCIHFYNGSLAVIKHVCSNS